MLLRYLFIALVLGYLNVSCATTKYTEAVNSLGQDDQFWTKEDEKAVEPIPSHSRDTKGILLVVEGIEPGGKLIRFRLINAMDSDRYITGYSLSAPDLDQKLPQGDEWVQVDRPWRCGTGLRACKLPADRSSTFTLRMPKPGAPRTFKIGLDTGEDTDFYQSARVKVWSEPINVDELPKLKK